MNNLENCPCCGNHCVKGSCKCNKGVMYFSKLKLQEKVKQDLKKNK